MPRFCPDKERVILNYKRLLKFYFCADGLNGAMDSLIIRFATSSADCAKSCEYYADKISRVIQAKTALGELWAYLDSVLSSVTEEDRRVLKAYSERGTRSRAAKSVAEGEKCAQDKAVHRSLMKFSRRVRGRLDRFAEQVKVLQEYYCFVCAPFEKDG